MKLDPLLSSLNRSIGSLEGIVEESIGISYHLDRYLQDSLEQNRNMYHSRSILEDIGYQ